jgi:hypothetical protein
MAARRAARHVNPVGINIETFCAPADETDGVATVTDVFRKTTVATEAVFDGENRKPSPLENIPATDEFQL